MKFAGKGKDHYKWTGDKASYGAIHLWLRKTYGKADRCENPKCPKKSKIFEYALIKGKKHERKRKNYKKLCRSCHDIYDETYKNFKNEI